MAHQVTLKLAVAEDRHAALQRLPPLAKASSREQQSLVSIYYDTGRLALRRAGLLLRLRRHGASWVQTLKRQAVSDAGLTIRPEWQAPYLNHFDFSGIDDDAVRHWLERERIASRISAVFETNFRRTIWHIEPRADVHITAKLDRGWLASDGRREQISELELQLLSGSIDDVYALALELARAQPLPLLLPSKAERGYRLYRNTPSRPSRARDIDLRNAESPLGAFRRIALDCLAHLQSNHAGAIHGEDPEYVHQMRVGTRRLRAAIRMFRPVLPEGMEGALAPHLRDLMRELGLVRDLDVLIREIVAPVAHAIPDEPRLTDLAGAIAGRRFAARDRVRHFLRQPCYGELLLTAARTLHQSPFVDPPLEGVAESTLIPFADRRLRRLLRHIHELAATARIDHPPSLHELRIAIKRLRYAIEFFGTVLPGKTSAGVIKRLSFLQDLLGQLNDLASAGNLLMVCAGRDQHLREAVTLIGGWHGQRHAELLAAIPDQLAALQGLKLPRLR